MNVIDRFLKEDMLIVKPSVFIYINKKDKYNVINNGINVRDGKISAYLTRLPESVYPNFLRDHYPVRVTLSKLKKIKGQIVHCKAKNIDGVDDFNYRDSDLLDKLIKKYSHYLNVCYKDNIPMEDIPHLDIYLSSGLLPGFVCKVLDT